MTPTLDTGAGPSLIRMDMLPPGWKSQLHPHAHLPNVIDANKNPIPVKGMITLYMRSGGFGTTVDCVVVPRLAVPFLLGTSFIDRRVEALYPRQRRIRWANRATVPILSCTQKGQRERRTPPTDTTVRLAERRALPPRSRTMVTVTTRAGGQVLVNPYNRLHKRHGCQTAHGLAVCTPGERFQVEVLNLSDRPVCLRKGTILATTEIVDAIPCTLVTDAPAPQDARRTGDALREVDLSDVPPELRSDVEALLRKHAYMLDGTLGSIETTRHRIELQPGAKPIRQQPYRAGHHARDIIRDEVNRCWTPG